MKTHLTYKRMEPDTILGDKLVVEMVCSSHNTEEIDRLEEYYKETIGLGIVSDDNKTQKPIENIEWI